MKMNWKREILGIAVLAALVIISIHYYPILPARMPSHFDFQGKVNGWTGKNAFFVMWGAIIILTYLLISFLPFIDPLRKKIEPKFKILLIIRDVMLVVFAVIFIMSINAALGGKTYVNYMGVLLGILLVVLGNYMPKFPQNWFIGIKTPWTISSEIVWKKTHILGGWMFTAAGFLYVVAALLKMSPTISLIVVLLAAFIPVGYSFILYKRLQKPKVPGRSVE